MPDLVTQVSEHRAVGLAHRDPYLFSMGVVDLGQIERDHTVIMAGGPPSLPVEQVEGQPAALLGRPDIGRPSSTSSKISRRLAASASANSGRPTSVAVGRPGPRQRARTAQRRRRVEGPISQLQTAMFLFARNAGAPAIVWSLAPTMAKSRTSRSKPGDCHESSIRIIESRRKPQCSRKSRKTDPDVEKRSKVFFFFFFFCRWLD